MCSMSMAAPCIIDDGASFGTLARLVTTPMIRFAAFMDTVGVCFGRSLYLDLFPACSNVPDCSGSANKRHSKRGITVALPGVFLRGGSIRLSTMAR